jgi:hypothetical protein
MMAHRAPYLASRPTGLADSCQVTCGLVIRGDDLVSRQGRSDTVLSFRNRSAKSVTFQGKLDLPIHRWFRLTPSFAPQLADDIADHFGLTGSDLVLDPFGGVGTVSLCMKYKGIPSCSIEINPFLHFVAQVKTRAYADIAAFERCFEEFIDAFLDRVSRVDYRSNPGEYLAREAAEIPAIMKPERWWSASNLAQLVCLRKLVKAFDAEPAERDLLLLAVSSILIPVSNARHNHVSLSFASEPLPVVDVASILKSQLSGMADDLRAMAPRTTAAATIYRGNSKEVTAILPEGAGVSAVITSPPYPNRFSYARETRPHLFFFDFIENAAAVGRLETEAIGGTWGRATSVLYRGIAPKNRLVERLLEPYFRETPARGAVMASYVAKYFNDLFDHAAGIAEVCRNEARLGYVIGNSKFYGRTLASDEILAAVFEHFGFRLERIDRMRKRQSKTGLHESVVFMRRQRRLKGRVRVRPCERRVASALHVPGHTDCRNNQPS